MDCIFCKIVSGDIPSEKVFENDHVLGFKDLHPQAPTHLLFIHKEHSENVHQMDGVQVAQVFAGITEFISGTDLETKGHRIVTNIGHDGGQTVFHTHFHVLGGAPLRGFGT